MERQSFAGLLIAAALAGAVAIPRATAPGAPLEPLAGTPGELNRLRPEPASSFWPIVADFLPSKKGRELSIEQHPGLLVESGFRFEHLVITVPDPEATAYPHNFDESIESVRYAVEEEGYSFDRYWLPWRPKQEERTPPPVGMPGLILFRHGDGERVLAVFLIAENPQSGIDKAAFHTAVDAIRGLSGNKGTWFGDATRLRVVGPTFSGSITSLQLALSELKGVRDVKVVSGSATRKENGELLKRGRDGKGYDFALSYTSMLESDERVLALLSEYLKKSDPEAAVALVTETGTDFGESVAQAAREQTTARRDRQTERAASKPEDPSAAPAPAPRNGRWIVLRFPMDLAAVRRAYFEDPNLKKLWSSRSAAQEGVPQLSVGGTARTTGNIPIFAPEETSPARDNTLRSMFTMLTRRSVDLVGIAATNTSDGLFLAALTQKYAPNARPFLLDSDVLYLGSPHGVPMTGMLFATNYPLFLRNQGWTATTPSRGSRQFTSRYAQAMYNATQTAIEGATRIEQAWPFAAGVKACPPVWLTVAGNEAFWPVALLDRRGEGKSAEECGAMASARAAGAGSTGLPRPSKIWTVLFFVLACWCMVHAIAFVYHNYTKQEGDWMSLYWLDPDGEKQCTKRLYLGMATGCLLVLLVSIGMIHLWSEHRSTPVIRGFIIALLAAPAGLLLANAVALALPSRVHLKQYLMAAGAFTLATAGALPAVELEWLDSADLYGYFFIFRSLNPGNGVSPLLSAALLVIGLYSWAMMQVRRLRTYELRRECLPQLTADMTFMAGQKEVATRLTRSFRDSVFNPALFAGSIAIIVVCAVVTVRWATIRTFERPWFNIVYETLLLALFAAVVLSMARFLAGWLALRRLLALLEWHPVRTAFGELDEFSWTGLWKRGASKQTFTTTIRSFERLREIIYTPEMPATAVAASSGAAAQAAPAWMAIPGFWPTVAEFESGLTTLLERETREQRQPVALYRDLQEKLLAISQGFERTLLSPFWQQSRADSRGWTPMHKAAEQFVALRFVAYIRYVMLQLREQLEFVSTAFIVGLLSFNMYPFEPHRSIISGATMLFAAVAVTSVFVFMQMDRNPLMNRLSGGKADKLDLNFALRLVSYGALPLLTLLSSYFPWAGSMFRSWVQPALDAMR